MSAIASDDRIAARLEPGPGVLLRERRLRPENGNQFEGPRRHDCAVLRIDLVDFKGVRELYGPAGAARLLRAMTDRLKGAIRPADVLSSVGHAEFLLLADMPLPDRMPALALAERLHRAMESAPFAVPGQQPVRLGICVGVAAAPTHGALAVELLHRAEAALGQARRSPGARSALFDAELEAELPAIYELERDLQGALGREEFGLEFQPTIDLTTGRAVGIEALARWTHPRFGAINPMVFIPMAARSDLIVKIGRWVRRAALDTQAERQREGLPKLPVSVNVSGMELGCGAFVEGIASLLQEYQLAPDSLAVELSESVLHQNMPQAMRVLTGLRQLGVPTSLDDFGVGPSSLSQLRQLPLNMLKVAPTFTMELSLGAHARSFTQAILRVGEALGLTTLAEGIETKEQLKWLREHNCRLGQGFLFGQPAPAEKLVATIAEIESQWPRFGPVH
jgi:diguanylate cyclase (GGDEF)-like protein